MPFAKRHNTSRLRRFQASSLPLKRKTPLVCWSEDEVRHKAAGVSCDWFPVLADSHATGITIHHPATENRIIPVATRQRVNLLVDEGTIPIDSVGLENRLAVMNDGDIRALAPQD